MDIQLLKYLSSLLLFVQGYFCYSSSASASAAASASSQSYSSNFPLYPPHNPHSHDGWVPTQVTNLPPPLPPLVIDNTNKDNNIMNLLFLMMALKNKKPSNPCCCCPHQHHHPPPHHPHGTPVDIDDSCDAYEAPVAEITVHGGYYDEPVSCGNAKIITSPGSEPNEIHLIIRTDFAPPC